MCRIDWVKDLTELFLVPTTSPTIPLILDTAQIYKLIGYNPR